VPKKEVVQVLEQRPYWERMVFGTGHGFRAEREEKVLRYINHRIDADADLRDVLQEPYVRRNCSQDEIDEILRNPELVHHCREHLAHVFASGELDPKRHH
jgi:hypothetical protein